jgi:hypothetical protein
MNIRMNELHLLCENDIHDNNIPSHWKFYKNRIPKQLNLKMMKIAKFSTNWN